jgi:bacteriocin biosynthesis cyclodehydratase domain-containing protein
VHVRSGGTASATDAVPGGLLPGDEHRPYATAAAEAVRRAAPEADTRPPGSLRPPGLIVLADQHAFQPPGSLPHYTRRAALLPLVLRDGSAVIGPLAVPGLTCCLNCVELHRVDRDPAWPAIAAQLRTGPAGHEEPSQAALIATAAGLAAMQALSFLDGGQPEAFGRSLELPGLGEPVRRRTWSPHPRCGCGGSQAGSRASPADHAPRKLPRSG